MPDTNMKVLVVDDFATMRRIVRNGLKLMGFEDIVEAENGEKAYALVEKGDIGFVVSDWNMPEMDGLELLKKMRAHPDYKRIPFLMVTAEGEKDKVIAAVQAGVSNYIVKPFTNDTLKEKVEKVLG